MNDTELCELFGTSVETIEREVAAVESGDLSAFDFGRVMLGRPMTHDKMESISLKVPHSRVVAIERAAKEQSITRSEFLRRAIDHELIASA